MRYQIKLLPSGAIGHDIGLVLPLSPKGTVVGGDANTTIVNLGGCAESHVDFWIVESSAGQTKAVISTAVRLLEDDSVAKVPFANSNVYASITIGSGCLVDPDCIEWSAASDDPLLAFIFVAGPRFQDVGSCNSVSVIAYHTDGSLDYTSTTFTVTGTVDGVQIGPSIVFECKPTLYNSVFGVWCVQQVDGSAVPCAPGTQDFCNEITYAADNGDNCHIDVVNDGDGNGGFSWHSANDLSWTIVQQTGPTQNLTAQAADGTHTWFLFDDGVDYTGTSYLLTANLNGNAFGDSITVTCEV